MRSNDSPQSSNQSPPSAASSAYPEPVDNHAADSSAFEGDCDPEDLDDPEHDEDED